MQFIILVASRRSRVRNRRATRIAKNPWDFINCVLDLFVNIALFTGKPKLVMSQSVSKSNISIISTAHIK